MLQHILFHCITSVSISNSLPLERCHLSCSLRVKHILHGEIILSQPSYGISSSGSSQGLMNVHINKIDLYLMVSRLHFYRTESRTPLRIIE